MKSRIVKASEPILGNTSLMSLLCVLIIVQARFCQPLRAGSEIILLEKSNSDIGRSFLYFGE